MSDCIIILPNLFDSREEIKENQRIYLYRVIVLCCITKEKQIINGMGLIEDCNFFFLLIYTSGKAFSNGRFSLPNRATNNDEFKYENVEGFGLNVYMHISRLNE